MFFDRFISNIDLHKRIHFSLSKSEISFVRACNRDSPKKKKKNVEST